MHSTPTIPHQSLEGMDGLQRRLDALPAELLAHIYDLTFTAGPAVYAVNAHYRPPANMQVSHSTRRKVAPEYYARTQFHCTNHLECLQWLLSLPPAHVQMLREVHCESVSCSWMLDVFEYEVKVQSSYLLYHLHLRGVKLPDSILCFQVSKKDKMYADYHWKRYL